MDIKKTMKIQIALILVMLVFTGSILAQSVGINDDGTAPHSKAMLDVKSITKGFLPPRMTAAQRDAITGAPAGLIIWCTNCGPSGELHVYNGTTWKNMVVGNASAPQFACGDPIIDARDSKSYSTVLIGTQCWMAQNLNIGTKINNGSGNQENNGTIEKYCYGDFETNCDSYGGLYQWDEAMQYVTTEGVQGICPAGWHLPTDAEWTTLTTYVNSQTSNQCNSTSGWIGKAMAAKTLWNSSPTSCTVGNDPSSNNATGFSALPGGQRHHTAFFGDLGMRGSLWTSTQTGTWEALTRSIHYVLPEVASEGGTFNKIGGSSVRCLKD